VSVQHGDARCAMVEQEYAWNPRAMDAAATVIQRCWRSKLWKSQSPTANVLESITLLQDTRAKREQRPCKGTKPPPHRRWPSRGKPLQPLLPKSSPATQQQLSPKRPSVVVLPEQDALQYVYAVVRRPTLPIAADDTAASAARIASWPRMLSLPAGGVSRTC